MKKIVLIACSNKKFPSKSKAKNLYISPLFTLCLQYAQSLNSDKIYILSAKHGLVDSEQRLKPYNKTLNTMAAKQIKTWAGRVLNQLKKVSDPERDEYIFLAGNNYRRYLIPHLRKYKVPLKGLRIGEQLQYLKNQT